MIVARVPLKVGKGKIAQPGDVIDESLFHGRSLRYQIRRRRVIEVTGTLEEFRKELKANPHLSRRGRVKVGKATPVSEKPTAVAEAKDTPDTKEKKPVVSKVASVFKKKKVKTE